MDEKVVLLKDLVVKSDLTAVVTKLVSSFQAGDTAVTNAYKALIGELGNQPLPEGAEEGAVATPHTVVSYIAAKLADVNADAIALEGRVKDNEDAIALLNNNSEVEGSVDYKITQAFNDFATKMSDDKVVNTFKEMIDYVAAHGTEYANLAALVGTLPEDAGVSTIVAYIEKLVGAEKTRAEGAEGDLQDAIDAINNEETGILKQAKDYADGLAENYDEAGAAAAVQGETTKTVKDMEDAFASITTLSAEGLAEVLALIP